jgi:hypothetical protein
VLREVVDGGLEGLLLARRDEHAGARLQVAAGDHRADAAGAAGDDGPLARDVEQVQSSHGPPV